MQSISQILNDSFIGKEVKIHGWVYRSRSSSKLCFIIIRDHSDIIQTVGKLGELSESDFKNLSGITNESSIEVSGIISKDERAVTGFELTISSFRIYQRNDNFPITKDQGEEFLLDNRHLWIRSREFNSILKIRSNIFKAFSEFFFEKGFYEVHPPMMVSSATEGGSTLFKVPFFGETAFLTQSAQFYLETFIFSLEKVFTVSPSFRAEKSRTWRHLTEYWHAEGEVAWIGNEEMMDVEEALIKHIIKSIIENNKKELEILNRSVTDLQKFTEPFYRMTYADLIKKAQSFGLDIKYGDDLGADEERAIMVNFDRPVFVTHFPEELKTFYHRPDPENPGFILCHDLLAPEGYGEIIGGGERIWSIDELKSRIAKAGLKEEDYYWYLDLRKYGSIPHSGFGLGLDRLCLWLMKQQNIKDVIGYPRTIRRLRP
ncbi:MAG: asparagine--tRNA ligase [Thermoplasmataceae archaeon]